MLTMAFQCLDLNAQKLEDLCEETVHVCTLYKGALLELLLIIYIYFLFLPYDRLRAGIYQENWSSMMGSSGWLQRTLVFWSSE